MTLQVTVSLDEHYMSCVAVIFELCQPIWILSKLACHVGL